MSGDWEREGRSQIQDFYIQANCLCLLCASRWLLENVDKFPQTSILTLGSLPAVSCLLSIRRPLRSLSPSRSPSGGPHSSYTIQNPIGIDHGTRHLGWRERRSGHSHLLESHGGHWVHLLPVIFFIRSPRKVEAKGTPWTPVLHGWPYCEQDGHAMLRHQHSMPASLGLGDLWKIQGVIWSWGLLTTPGGHPFIEKVFRNRPYPADLRNSNIVLLSVFDNLKFLSGRCLIALGKIRKSPSLHRFHPWLELASPGSQEQKVHISSQLHGPWYQLGGL